MKFEAKLLVEELMVTANSRVAAFLAARCPNQVVLLKNAAPKASDLDNWMRQHRATLHHSGALQARLRRSGRQPGRLLSLHVSSEVRAELEAARARGDVGRMKRLLLAEPWHPALLLALQDFAAIRPSAAYAKLARGDQEEVTHVGLNCRLYTHFSSPLRRYCDVVIHR